MKKLGTSLSDSQISLSLYLWHLEGTELTVLKQSSLSLRCHWRKAAASAHHTQMAYVFHENPIAKLFYSLIYSLIEYWGV